MAGTNKTKYAILGVLNIASGSGYDIKKICDYSISHFWNENYSHIYPVLKELEQEGLVVKKSEFNAGKPPKYIYSLIDEGKKELNDWLRKPVESNPMRSEFLLKLFFASELPIEDIIRLVDEEKTKHEKLLAQFLKIEEDLGKNQQSGKALSLWLATVNFGKYEARSTIEWCEDTVKTLRDIETQNGGERENENIDA